MRNGKGSMKTKVFNGFFHILEFFFAWVLLQNAFFFIFSTPEIATEGPIAAAFGSDVAITFYGMVYAVLAILLLVSKFFKRKKMHQHSLYGIAMTLLFVFFIELVVRGWGVHVIDTAVIFVLVSWAYLRWKLKTAYIGVSTFHKQLNELRRD